MTLKCRTHTLLILALLLAGTPLLHHSPRGTEKIASNLAAPAASAHAAAAILTPDAQSGARQEQPQSGKASPQDSAADREAVARGGDARKGLVRLRGEVPVSLARAERVRGSAAGDSPMTLTLVLNRDDQRGFDEFLHAAQDPQSPTYRHYLSPREQADRFGPSQQGYEAVRGWLRDNGFPVVEGSANRLTLTARATRKRAEEVFGVQIGDYRIGDRTFYANDREPAVPEQIASHVQAVIGLSNLARPRASDLLTDLKKAVLKAFGKTPCEIEAQLALDACTNVLQCDGIYEKAKQACLARTATGATGGANGPSGSSGGRSPLLASGATSADTNRALAQLASSITGTPDAPLSGAPAATRWADIDGTGQKIGLLEFDTFNVKDIRDYLALAGFPPTYINRLSQVHVNGGATLGPNESEVLIDIIATLVNAPGANVVVYDAPFAGNTNFQAVFNRMIGDGVTVIGNSWAYCEDQTTLADVQSLDSVLASAAAAGISVFNASGDSGSTCLDGSPNTICVPADSPHATAVGGTSLTLGPATTYIGETIWAGLNDALATGQGGFGVSRFFPRPAYQNGFNNSPMRSIPDVAVNADPANGLRICQADAGGCPTELLYGGTSLAAPLWAAFGALLNQAQGTNLGNLNPLLYPLGNTSAFHSAASMGTDFQHVGLGSPNLNLLHRALSGDNIGAPLAAAAGVGAVSPGVSQVKVVPERVRAEENSTGFVVVLLRDADGNSVSGKTVSLTANPSTHVTITPTQGVSNVANGAVIFLVKNTSPEAVTFTATDTTDGVVLSSSPTITFISPPAAAGGISASPTTVNANGVDTTTITVTLQDAQGHPSPGKLVSLSQGGGGSMISGATARTDANGRVQFTATDFNAETVTYTAVDVTDQNLPIPGSATVSFVNSSGNCARPFNGTAAPGYAVSTFASGFPLDCFVTFAPIGLAFDQNGTLFVGDTIDSSIYAFGPQGGAAGPATLVGRIPPSVNANGLAGLTFTKDGRFYVAMNNGAKLLEVNPATAEVIRVVVAALPANPLDLHVDPLSGDLFVSSGDGIHRISNFATGPGTVTLYARGDVDGFTFAPDGTIYAAGLDGVFRVEGPNSQTPGAVRRLAFVGGRPDGLALEPNPADPSKPFLYANRNDGRITRIDTSALPDIAPNCNDPGTPCTDIFTNGSRGDFVTVGPSGCLFATQSDRIIRLTNADGTCSLTPTNPVPQITLTPDNVSAAQGTAVTFTAQLKNVASLEGVPITLRFTGANAGAHLLTTDVNGNATFTYTGIETGTDKVVAYTDINGTHVRSNEGTLSWTPGKHTTFLSLNRSPAAGSTNRPLALAATLVDVSSDTVAGVAGVPVTFTLAGQTCAGTTDAAGRANCSLTPTVAAGSYPLTATFAGTSQLLASSASKRVELLDAPAAASPTVQFSAAAYQVGEGDGRITITFTRSGDLSAAVSVGYQTVDTDAFRFGCADTVNNQGGAFGRCDYATVVGTLNFAAGETSKTVTVPVIDDVYVEGDETFQVALANAVGATVGTPATATVTIKDNDAAGGAPNPVLRSDFFVRQHYLDFLSREPEAAGLAAYLNLLNNCPDVNNVDPNSPSAVCDRLTVSAAFFGSPEFRLKGFYVFNFYRVAFGRLPRYGEIVFDMSAVTGRTAADTFARKAAFTDSFVQRQEFTAAYGARSNTDYVNALLGRYGLTQITTPDPAAPDDTAKVTLTNSDLIARLNAGTLTRAQVLRAVADSDQVAGAEFNRAFVAAEYYGYLRRTPDTPGFNAWLNYLTQHPDDARTMVNGFLNSQEYKLRFGQP